MDLSENDEWENLVKYPVISYGDRGKLITRIYFATDLYIYIST